MAPPRYVLIAYATHILIKVFNQFVLFLILTWPFLFGWLRKHSLLPYQNGVFILRYWFLFFQMMNDCCEFSRIETIIIINKWSRASCLYIISLVFQWKFFALWKLPLKPIYSLLSKWQQFNVIHRFPIGLIMVFDQFSFSLITVMAVRLHNTYFGQCE